LVIIIISATFHIVSLCNWADSKVTDLMLTLLNLNCFHQL